MAKTINQCDGCKRKLPIVDGIHYTPGSKYAYMYCTKDKYKEKVVNKKVINEEI